MVLRDVAQTIIDSAIRSSLPDEAVKRTLKNCRFEKKVHLVAIGKAAWQMARAAVDCIGSQIQDGIVITKYGHIKKEIPGLRLFEAGHPVPDENSCRATEQVIQMVSVLGEEDVVLFLVSGGGSALFEKPLIPLAELESITTQLLSCGADITEINTIRKRLSAVKGGRFGELCKPARVFAVVLSDIIGDPLDMIASGPACPDVSTAEQAQEIILKYGLTLSEQAKELLLQSTPKELDNVQTVVTGSVKQLCRTATQECLRLGYEPHVLTDSLTCVAKEAGSFLAAIARYHAKDQKPQAYILGGETVVYLTGKGKGGRNQELALSAAAGISGLKNVALFSVGSDGTDGPTDAAGGYVDGTTAERLAEQGICIADILHDNNAYYALKAADGLIMTGPTGTNVNDLTVLLIDVVPT